MFQGILVALVAVPVLTAACTAAYLSMKTTSFYRPRGTEVHAYVHTHARTHARTHTHTHARTHACTHTHTANTGEDFKSVHMNEV